MSVTEFNQQIDTDTEQIAREELAASFRWAARWGMHEAIANHFSYVISTDPCRFLVNPSGAHFARVRASDLIVVEAGNKSEMERPEVDPTAFCIHSALHLQVPHARCIMHVHPRYATALASVKDRSMPPIDQNTARFFKRVHVDEGFGGMGMGDEANRLAENLANKPIVLMGNHGVASLGATIARALDELYYYERAAETLMIALASGRELDVISDAVAELTAQQWEQYLVEGSDRQHLDQLLHILDDEEPDFRD